MRQVTGADVGAARIHVGGEADRLNDVFGSHAFTVGADVFVRRHEYRPGSAQGDALLAHELTHAVQQRATAAAAVQRWFVPGKEGRQPEGGEKPIDPMNSAPDPVWLQTCVAMCVFEAG